MAHADSTKDPYAAWERGRLRTALRLFAAQAKTGDSSARLNLGYFYDVGLGTRRNKAQALRWYRLAYRQGSGAAASNIATVYRDEGRPALALAWYRRAVSLAVAALKRAVASDDITPAGREEARRLLRRVQRMPA
jgi:uncharacterized protein